MDDARARLQADIDIIRAHRDRTGKLETRPLRWVGEPLGWRTMGDMDKDLEEILND